MFTVAFWFRSGHEEGGPLCRLPVCRRSSSSGGMLLQRVCWCLLWEDPQGEQTERLGPQHPAGLVFIDQLNLQQCAKSDLEQLSLHIKCSSILWREMFYSFMAQPSTEEWMLFEKGPFSLVLKRAFISCLQREPSGLFTSDMLLLRWMFLSSLFLPWSMWGMC